MNTASAGWRRVIVIVVAVTWLAASCGRIEYAPTLAPGSEGGTGADIDAAGAIDASGSPRRDAEAGTSDSATSGVDASGVDASAGVDGGDALDARASPDAPPPDATGTVANDDCDTAIDVTAGGDFAGTTCGAVSDEDTGCAPPGTPDVYFRMVDRAGAFRSSVVTSGFVIASFSTPGSRCDTGARDILCAPTFAISGGSGGTDWLVVERLDGTCGDFVLTVTP
jgi:hypothetical protein